MAATGIVCSNSAAGRRPVIDLDRVYDPCQPNDRLLLGMEESISAALAGALLAGVLCSAC